MHSMQIGKQTIWYYDEEDIAPCRTRRRASGESANTREHGNGLTC